MRLDDYLEGVKPDEAAERRRLAEEKSYEILEYVERVADRFKTATRDGTVVGSTSPSIFVGRANYPAVPTGILAPVGEEERAAEFETSGAWYDRGLDIEQVLQYRAGLLNSNRTANVDAAGGRPASRGTSSLAVHDVWDGFVGVQREVAIADRPVDVELGLSADVDLDLSLDDVTTPRGPRARAERAELTENPSVPRAVEKTLEDDDWNAQGAMRYLYRRGFDVYDINTILSAGALGRAANRRLVPTRWSITAVDDAIGEFLRGRIRNRPSIDEVQVWVNEYVGNRYWVVLAPGTWEFELVEMKSPGSVWNPDQSGDVWMASAHEEYVGRSDYVDETAGAYYAARLGVLEHLADEGRQAKALVLREVSDDYWAPVGVWQIRESVRNAFDGVPGGASDRGPGERGALAGEYGTAESFDAAVEAIVPELPVSSEALRRKSTMVAGLQSALDDFASGR